MSKGKEIVGKMFEIYQPSAPSRAALLMYLRRAREMASKLKPTVDNFAKKATGMHPDAYRGIGSAVADLKSVLNFFTVKGDMKEGEEVQVEQMRGKPSGKASERKKEFTNHIQTMKKMITKIQIDMKRHERLWMDLDKKGASASAIEYQTLMTDVRNARDNLYQAWLSFGG